jgi:hypothetical protein
MRKLLLRGGTTVAMCVAVLVAPTIVVASNTAGVKQIEVRDDCDPATFNVIGLGNICVGNGRTTFAKLADQVTRTGRAAQWRFIPDSAHIKLGDSFRATNSGGEAHSFTEVAKFGPSVIPDVNDLLGMHGATPNKECSDAFTAFNTGLTAVPPNNDPQLSTFMLPGQSFKDTPEEPATELYQCCIHPWMQAVVTVR